MTVSSIDKLYCFVTSGAMTRLGHEGMDDAVRFAHDNGGVVVQPLNEANDRFIKTQTSKILKQHPVLANPEISACLQDIMKKTSTVLAKQQIGEIVEKHGDMAFIVYDECDDRDLVNEAKRYGIDAYPVSYFPKIQEAWGGPT